LKSGFDNVLSLKLITDDHIDDFEKSIDSNRNIFLDGLDCVHATLYRNQKAFKFLPAHKIILLKWPAQISSVEDQITSTNELNRMCAIDHPAFSPVMREMIMSALSNFNKDPKGRTFSEVLMNFSIYMYILAGKVSYETICANLLLPKAGTVRKCPI